MSTPNPNGPTGQGLSDKTQESFVSLHVITACCHAVLNTQFIAPDPKPAWFDGLNGNLDAAKAAAQTWIDKLSVDVTSSVPTAVIDYGTTYKAFTDQIHAIAQAHPDASGASDPYVKQIAGLVDALLQSVGQIIATVDTTATNLQAWQTTLQKAHDALTSGASNIQAAEADLQADIGKMNSAIAALNADIAAENKAIAIAAGAIGVGLLLLVVGIALAPETGGASLIVAGIGGAAVIGGGVTWGVMQDKINKQFDQIAADTKELNADKRQLVALQGLGQASDLAITSLAQASQALSDFRTSWGVFEGELKGVQTKLNQAEQSLIVIVQDAFTTAAAAEWAEATEFAQNLSEGKVELQAQTLTPSAAAPQIAA